MSWHFQKLNHYVEVDLLLAWGKLWAVDTVNFKMQHCLQSFLLVTAELNNRFLYSFYLKTLGLSY